MSELSPFDFVVPTFDAPIDVAAQKTLVQKKATVKGMQMQALVDECAKRGAPLQGRRYVAFRDYPGEELVELLALAAERAWPDVSPREGLRRLGRVAYPTLRRSLVGRVIFGAFLGGDVHAVWPLVTKGYEISGSTGTAKLLELEKTHAIVRFEGIYTFLDAWHVGIIEGAVDVYGFTPDVRIRLTSRTSGDFFVSWK